METIWQFQNDTFFWVTSKSIINQRKSTLPCSHIRGNKKNERKCVKGAWLSYTHSKKPGSLSLRCERARLTLEPRLQGEPWLLILLIHFSQVDFSSIYSSSTNTALYNVRITAEFLQACRDIPTS